MSIKNKNISYFAAVFRGFFWNITHIRNTFKARKIIQKNRIIDDKEIEKHMINHLIELEGVRMIIRQFLKRKN